MKELLVDWALASTRQPLHRIAPLLTDLASWHGQIARRLATRLVHGEGMTVREVGRVLGLSYQRVSQLVASV